MPTSMIIRPYLVILIINEQFKIKNKVYWIGQFKKSGNETVSCYFNGILICFVVSEYYSRAEEQCRTSSSVSRVVEGSLSI